MRAEARHGSGPVCAMHFHLHSTQPVAAAPQGSLALLPIFPTHFPVNLVCTMRGQSRRWRTFRNRQGRMQVPGRAEPFAKSRNLQPRLRRAPPWRSSGTSWLESHGLGHRRMSSWCLCNVERCITTLKEPLVSTPRLSPIDVIRLTD